MDVCVIEGEKTTLMRNYVRPNERGRKEKSYRFERGTTAVLDQRLITREEISKYVTVQEIGGDEEVAAEMMEVD